MFTLGYRLQFENVEEQTVTVIIWDRETYTDDIVEPTYIELPPAGSPFSISTVNNQEDPFSPIRAKQADIRFQSNNEVKQSTFQAGADYRWYVHAYLDEELYTLFKGHLVIDDLSQEFLDDNTNCEVTLTATDGLGLLRDIPLTDLDGNTPRDKHTIMEYLVFCLQNLGYDYAIFLNHNLMGEDTPGLPMYGTHYLDAKTFEEEIGECENCYEVLEKILGEDSFLTQYKGDIWIIRVEEMDAGLRYVHTYNSSGTYTGTLAAAHYDLTIEVPVDGEDANDIIYYSDEATQVTGRRAKKYIKETFNYEYPKEIVDNIDFSRGDIMAPVSIEGGTAYEIDDWTLAQYPVGAPVATRTNAYIVRKFTDGYETERYITIEPSPELLGSESLSFLESNPIPVHRGDKFTVSVDIRHTIEYASPTSRPFLTVRLLGEDGSRYWLGNFDGEIRWLITNATYQNNELYTEMQGVTGNGIDWHTYSWESSAIPTDGVLYIQLWEGNWEDSSSYDDQNVQYQNLQFNYIPHINGSYSKYSGQYNKIESSLDTKAKREEEVKISDSPKKLFKGALFKNVTWDTFGESIVSFTGEHEIKVAWGTIADFAPGTWVRFTTGVSPNNYIPFYVVSSSEAGGIITLVVLQTVTVDGLGFNGHNLEKMVLGTYSLASLFYPGNVFPNGLPDYEYRHSFAYNQAFGVWNQNNRILRLFDVSCQGLKTALLTPPDTIHKFFIEAVSPHSTNKHFMLLHYDMDFYTCAWSGTMCEVYDNQLGKSYSEAVEFKYISDK